MFWQDDTAGRLGRESLHSRPIGPGIVLLARKYFASRAFGWSIVILGLVTWQIFSTLHRMPELPPLTEIGATWLEHVREGDLATAVLDTLRITAFGYVIATVTGVILGFLMGRVAVVWGGAEPVWSFSARFRSRLFFPC